MKRIAHLTMTLLVLSLVISVIGCNVQKEVTNTQLAIEELPVSNITEISAVISWVTNSPASSIVFYTVSTGGQEFSITDDRLSPTHSIKLDLLQPDTSYKYRVLSEDTDGNKAISGEKVFRTEALPPNKGIIAGTIVYAEGIPANKVYVYIFKNEEPCSSMFRITDEQGQYTFTDLLFGHYEIYASSTKLGLAGDEDCVEKELYRPFNRPPVIVELDNNYLAIAPTLTHFRDIELNYLKEYINTNQPDISWKAVPTAAYYKIKIVDGYLNEGEHEDYEREITVTETRIIWPEQLIEMNYMVSVYAYDVNNNYLTDNYELFWIGHSSD